MEALKQLEGQCSIKADTFGGIKNAFILTFTVESVVTTIRVIFGDSSGAEMAITNMTTLPDCQIRKGYGKKALNILLEWASNNSMSDIRAIQVQKKSELFWILNGFVGLDNETNDFKYK